MTRKFKRTKILATIGPAVFSPEKIEALVAAGANGCRMNFSHGAYEEKEEQIGWIRAASKKLDKPVAIVQDLQGPKIRLGEIKDDHLDVHEGDILTLDYSVKEHDGSLTLPVQYNLAEKVKPGEPVYLFDGRVHTTATEVAGETAIKVKVHNSGYLMSKKGINLPETDMGSDILTAKDLQDMKFGASNDFDYVAISFIQSAQDILNVRAKLDEFGSNAKIIAKIETKKAAESIDAMEEIVKAADGIMVARGDMAYEVGLEVVPVVQRNLISLSRKHGKLCIVATQMMASMVDNPAPTRSEVNDVATAVVQGADCVMLSDETTVGKYPVQSVATMEKIIVYTQEHAGIDASLGGVVRGKYGDWQDALSQATVEIAEKVHASAIVCETTSGSTAEAVAANRPNLPILVVTRDEKVAQRLALRYACSSFVRDLSPDYGLDLARELLDQKWFTGDDPSVVITSGSTKGNLGGTDTIQVRKVA